MRRITLGELRDASAAIMDAVEAGDTFCITRRGKVVAQLRPVAYGVFVSSSAAKSALGRLLGADDESLRADANAFLGDDPLGH